MMHTKRCWCLSQAESPEQLARDLVDRTWTLCTGFRLQGYLFLNDATSADGAGEFAAVKELPGGGYCQVESITFSWCDYDRALQHINEVLSGACDSTSWACDVSPRLQTPEEHGQCGNCV